MNAKGKVMIVAPFWGQSAHVGVYRIDRFVRWLSAEGLQVILVKAGSVDAERKTSWGVEITVRDPLGLYRDAPKDNIAEKPVRQPNKLRRFTAYLLLNPDPGIIWARRAARHPKVIEYGNGARWIVSSSPPESAHVGAAILAKRLNAKLIVDMRDGWLDEPLKPLLRISRLQRWREGRLERAVLQQAYKIFVTSPVWQTLLEGRLTFTKEKVAVLTNGYPPEEWFDLKPMRKRSVDEPLRLLHTGRFTGSSLSRKVSCLLEPLLCGLGGEGSHGVVTLLGRLESVDREEVGQWLPRFESRGWSIEVKDAVPRDEMMALLGQADGLLLLSASQAAIPSKLFEYLPSGKPIFAATLESSAVWQICQSLPQVFLIDYTQPDHEVVQSFISACKTMKNRYEVPAQFSETVLSQIFLGELL